MKLGIAQINVTDVRKARDFYVNKLGFREVGKLSGVIQLSDPGGPTLLLYPVPKQHRTAYTKETGATLVFYLKDIDATVRRWRKRGVKFIRVAWSKEKSGIGECPFGRFIAFRDPFGNVHEILEPA